MVGSANLARGEHTFKMGPGGEGGRFDSLIVTDDAEYVPTGTGVPTPEPTAGPGNGTFAVHVSDIDQPVIVKATATGMSSGSVFRLTYDNDKLTLDDIALQRFEKITQPGDYGNLTVSSVQPGRVTFGINTDIPEGSTWSGLLSIFKFMPGSLGESEITLEVL